MGLSWGTPLYLLALYGLIAFFTRAKNDAFKNSKWSWIDRVAITLFVFFAGQLIGGLLAYLVPTLLGWGQDRSVDWLTSNSVGQFLTIVLVETITIVLVLRYLKSREKGLKDLGFTRKPNVSDLGYALLALVAYFFTYAAIAYLIKMLVPALDLEQAQDIGFEQVRGWQLPLVFISLVVLPPLTEEILVRGFLYGGLKGKLKHVPAVVITSGLFAIAHLQAGSGQPLLWIAAIDTFVLSVFLITLRDRTGSLWSSIFLHALKNGIAFVALFIIAK